MHKHRHKLTLKTDHNNLSFPKDSNDFFYIGYAAYLIYADRLISWLIFYYLKPGYASTSKCIFVGNYSTHIIP